MKSIVALLVAISAIVAVNAYGGDYGVHRSWGYSVPIKHGYGYAPYNKYYGPGAHGAPHGHYGYPTHGYYGYGAAPYKAYGYGYPKAYGYAVPVKGYGYGYPTKAYGYGYPGKGYGHGLLSGAFY